MSTITPISSMAATPASGNTTTPATTKTKALNQDDFLKLLSVQFQNQDPMKPMDDTAFIAQMAQFSSLEQSSAMAKDLASMRSDQTLLTANSYLGRNVTAVDASGTAPQVIINGLSFGLSAVLRVELGAVPAPAAPAA